MAAFSAGNLEASKKHCLKWYPNFKPSMDVVEKYCKAAGDFMNDRKETIHKDRLPMDLFLEYLEIVFKKTFKNDKSATNEIGRVVDVLQDHWKKDRKTVGTRSPKEILSLINSDPSLQTDFVTLMITLSLAHIHRSASQEKADPIQNPSEDGAICPVCGIKAHFGMLREEEGYRDLECWHCGHIWMIQRLQCPYCGEKEQHKMGFFEAEEIPGCRINFCKNCNGYVKIFDFREVEGFKPVLMLYHLATLIMDDLAVKEGFQPGSELSWSSAPEHKESACR